jgi:hypothetical protein
VLVGRTVFAIAQNVLGTVGTVSLGEVVGIAGSPCVVVDMGSGRGSEVEVGSIVDSPWGKDADKSVATARMTSLKKDERIGDMASRGLFRC